MPVHCGKRGSKWRILDSNGSIETTGKGNAVDGGGHTTESACQSQARAINSSLTRNIQRKPRLGQDIFNLPEFQAILDKLGFAEEPNLSAISITLRAEELVLIRTENDGPPLLRETN